MHLGWIESEYDQMESELRAMGKLALPDSGLTNAAVLSLDVLTSVMFRAHADYGKRPDFLAHQKCPFYDKGGRSKDASYGIWVLSDDERRKTLGFVWTNTWSAWQSDSELAREVYRGYPFLWDLKAHPDGTVNYSTSDSFGEPIVFTVSTGRARKELFRAHLLRAIEDAKAKGIHLPAGYEEWLSL